MARCSDCGVDVGCGCNLIKGRCPGCNSTYQAKLKNNELIKKIHVNTETK